jgi:hypothetical protein
MHRKRLIVFAVALLWCAASAYAQQAPPQALTFYYGYAVKPGKEDEFMNLVKTVGAPVRDKLMADGVIEAWGVEAPVLRSPGGITHLIWFSVNDWGGVEKVMTAMAAHIAKLDAEAAAPPAKGQKPGMTVMQRGLEVYDASKTRDWLIRDIVAGFTQSALPAGMLPTTRYNFFKVKAGKGADYRAAWEKYNKPVYDKLIADGVVLAYGLAAEEVKTDGNWTNFVWVATASLGALEQVRSAFIADRARRSPEEREAIGALFTSLTDPDAARSVVTRSLIFKLKM